MLDWLAANREWVFSGIGLSGIGLIATILKLRQANNDATKQISSVTQSPTITQAPVVHITNNVGSAVDTPFKAEEIPKPQSVGTKSPNQAVLFAVNPLVVTRELDFLKGVSADSSAMVCIARLKTHVPITDPIGDHFEASIDYVERLSASGMPIESRVAHINQAQWLPPNNGVQELLLAVEIELGLFAVNASESHRSSWADCLVELDLHSRKFSATVTLTDLSNGQKWQAEYEITRDIYERTFAVRERTHLRRH